MHPLELFDRYRRIVFGWFPNRQRWDRTPAEAAPLPAQDWLLEPLNREEAIELFPHLDDESAIIQYQKMRLQIRANSNRNF